MSDGVIEILTKELGLDCNPEIERPEVLFAYLRQLLGTFEHDMEVHTFVGRKVPPHVGRFLERLYQLCDGKLDPDESMQEAAAIREAMRNVWDSDNGPADRDMEFLSGITCAVRFGLETPCRSRWPAEVGGDLFKRHYGLALFDSNTARWQKEWMRDRFIDGLRALANANDTSNEAGDGCGRPKGA